MEPRKIGHVGGAEAFYGAVGNRCVPRKPCGCTPPGSENTATAQGSSRNLGDLFISVVKSRMGNRVNKPWASGGHPHAVARGQQQEARSGVRTTVPSNEGNEARREG